jgi:hypothetical protein
MATRSFVVETQVGAAPEAAIDFLAELDRHRGLHAYLQSGERVAQGTGAEGDWAEWKIVERPRLGPPLHDPLPGPGDADLADNDGQQRAGSARLHADERDGSIGDGCRHARERDRHRHRAPIAGELHAPSRPARAPADLLPAAARARGRAGLNRGQEM